MDALLDLAPVAALLAAFAFWIDRQNGRRIDDLAAANREAHALIGQRIAEQGRHLGERIDEQGRHLGQRIGDQTQRIDEQGRHLGQRIDDQAQRIDEQGRQLGERIDEQGRRIDEQGRRIDDLHGDVGKLHALLLAIVPRAAAAADDVEGRTGSWKG